MCDPITMGIIGVNVLASVGIGAGVNQLLKNTAQKAANSALAKANVSQLPSVAPTKTEEGIQQVVEGQRTRMNLSQLGFGANFQNIDGGGDTGALGVPGDYLRKALSAYRLGA